MIYLCEIYFRGTSVQGNNGFFKRQVGTQVFLHFFRKRNVNFLSHERNYLINILHELNSILQSELIKDHTTTSAFSTNKNEKLFQYTS